MLQRIKKNDLVCVISGKDMGKQGTVLAIDHKHFRIMVKGVAIHTKHVKPRARVEQGSIKKEEGFISLSKVMPVCTSCKKPCRIHTKTLGDSKKARVCHRCNESF